jgi:DNA-binding CsgD family transcriptional regulator
MSPRNGRGLSPREKEILRLLAEGKANKEVAAVLGISVKTVETHRTRVLHKLNLDSLVELVHYAIRNDIVKA